jgi:hypothetical protein
MHRQHTMTQNNQMQSTLFLPPQGRAGTQSVLLNQFLLLTFRFLSSLQLISKINTLPFIQSLTEQCSKNNMYRTYISLEYFKHNLVVMFLDDGKMVALMGFLFLGSGKMTLDI